MTHIVFVYGTLKHGLSNSRLLRQAEFLGPAVTVKEYMMVDTGGFPMCFPSGSQAHRVVGEVYAVTPDELKSLDRLEGHPVFFCREEIPVDMSDSGIVQAAWMYFGPDHDGYKNHPLASRTAGFYNWQV